jgi:predicted ATPase
MPRRSRKQPTTLPGSPFLNRVELWPGKIQAGLHPFTLPLLSPQFCLSFTTPITFLVGENGSGKSTLLEALAWALGFSAQGGNRDNSYQEGVDGHTLGRALHLHWRQKVTSGFFLRAETFFNFATYLEAANSTFFRYGGTSFHLQSHGEGFLALFEHHFEDGVYLLDEPEAALSPQRQLAFLRILKQLTANGGAQFVIATHSPMLLTFPGATVLSLAGGSILPVRYQDTEHYQLMRDFLNSPERFYRHLFAAEE